MADENLAPPSDWQKVRRTHRVARFSPSITLRRNGSLAVSADFARMAAIGDCTHASLFLAPDGLRLAIHFHANEADDDSFILARDGGNKSSPNRLINARSLLAQSPVASALAKEGGSACRLPPRKADGRWIVDLAPCFERTLSQSGEIAVGATGIYRYRNGNDTVYIGRGNLRDRLSQVDRRGWEFDRIEYSALNDDAVERRWESFWLDEFRRRHNRWPTYNRIAAVSAVAAKAG